MGKEFFALNLGANHLSHLSTAVNIKQTQQQQLYGLLERAQETDFGQKYNFSSIDHYQAFTEEVPLQFYNDLDITGLKEGKTDLYWPGKITNFAISAGTSGSGKHLPLSEERLNSDRQFMRLIAQSYLRQRPNIFRLAGYHLSLPGSIERNGELTLGEISGFSGIRAPFLLKPFQLVDPEKLTRLSFREKFDLIADKASEANLKVITAVPSWILTLFQRVLKKTGKSSIAEVWPDLQLLICGGVKLANYKPHLQKLMGDLQPDFIETYGASEGYFAFTDKLGKDDLKLVSDNGIFYEFIANPLPDPDAMSIQDTLPIWEVETGVPYAMVVSTNAGLWRYGLRDIIEFTSLNPPRIKVKGRVSEMLDDFGEGLYVYEAEEALEKTTAKLDLEPGNFTISPQLRSETEIPCHRWFVQFTDPVHTDTLNRLASMLDEYLIDINRHYAIRRESEALGAPRVQSITQDDINRWMEASEKDKAQGKLPKVLRQNVEVLQ